MSLDLYIGINSFTFRRGAKVVGTIPFATLELEHDKSVTEDELFDMRFYAKEFVPGQIMTAAPAVGTVLGPKRDFTHEVDLRGRGNPDYGQYVDVAPKRTVKVCGIEEAREVTMNFQRRYNLGGGNCGPDHGVVWEIAAGKKRKKAGYVGYSGHYETVAERKKWEADWKAKYHPATT